MQERSTYAPEAPRSVLLAVGCRGLLLARCRDAAGLVPIEIEAAELLALASEAASLRPLAILISADLYAFDPEEFDALALAVGARRILVEDSEPVERLSSRLRDAVKVVRASRARESSTSPGPTAAHDSVPTSSARRSGFRWTATGLEHESDSAERIPTYRPARWG